MEATEQKTQRRYSPEVRRAMILDTAAQMIASEGVSTLSMERISDSAGISKSLIYKYFESQTELLRELLGRELKALRLLQFDAAEKAETFEGLVRSVTHEYLKYIDERGLIIERLQSDPAISDVHDPTGYNRAGAVEYLADIVVKHFELPIELARAALLLGESHPAVRMDPEAPIEPDREPDADDPYDHHRIKYYGITMPFMSRFYVPLLGSTEVPCFEPPWSRLAVIDLNTNELMWSRPVGSMKDSGPFG